MREPRKSRVGRLAALALVIALAGVACRPGPDAAPVRVAAYPESLPGGPGRGIAERSCLTCHSATLITQQAKDSTAWAKTLATMEKWSAPVAPGERDSLLAYLVSTLGPRAH